MRIDPRDGTVTLPSGKELRRHQDLAEPTQFSGGTIDGRNLIVCLYHLHGRLTEITLTVDLYPPGANDWSSYSEEIEAKTRALHDRLAEEMLGPGPWTYPWGRVLSVQDDRGGGTFIIVRYA